VELAGLGRRAVALLLDFSLFPLLLVIGYIIWWVLVLGRGQTPGKQIMGVRIARADTGETADWGLSFFRVAMNDRKLVRMQEKGQVTIPTEIRKKLGLKRGDLVAVMETPEGVFIAPQQVVAVKAFDRIDELIASGREIRTDLLQETYGITQPPQEHLSR
jgi:AbrB family looped-hinge helix DNA binding protein